MPNSVFVGQPPISINDKLLYKGALIEYTRKGALVRLSPSFLEEVVELPRTSHHSRAPSLIIGSSIAIFLVMSITCLRLLVRKFRLRSVKADDWVIVPAAIGCVAFLSITIATESAGCMGKHIYNCTYDELGWTFKVSET